MNSRPVLGLTMGDPAGVGPELCLRAPGERSVLENCLPVLFANAGVLERVAEVIALRPRARRKGIPSKCSRAWRTLNGAESEALSHIDEQLVVDCATMDARRVKHSQLRKDARKAGGRANGKLK